MNLELHKELYFFEWSRKEQLAAAANLPVALQTILAGGLFYLLQSFPFRFDFTSAAFVALGVGNLASQVAGVVFVVRSLQDYWYQQVPPSDRLQMYYEDLKEWHEALGRSAEQCQRDFDEYLQSRLAEATAANLANNTRTAGALYNGRRAIVFALVFAGLSLGPYFWQSLRQERPVSAVKIEGPVHVRTEEDHPMEQGSIPQGQPQQSQTPQHAPQQQKPAATIPSVPPKPVGPPNVEVRNSGETREKR